MAEQSSQLSAQSLFNVSGWVAIVTGGGTGLGLMAARALAANGAKVYVTGRRMDRLKGAEMQDPKSGGSIIGLQMDVTSKDSIKEVVSAISQKEKFVNVLINNAGVSSVSYDAEAGRPEGTPSQISEVMMNTQDFDDWTSVYKVNVASMYFASVAFLPLLCAARDHTFSVSGSIINIASISGLAADSQDGQFSYNCSKAAAISLTKMLAKEFMRPGLEVRVNVIAPGFFPSEMVPSLERYRDKDKEFFRSLESHGIPAGRPGNLKEYAQAILNFATNAYCTGSTLAIDGGWLLSHS